MLRSLFSSVSAFSAFRVNAIRIIRICGVVVALGFAMKTQSLESRLSPQHKAPLADASLNLARVLDCQFTLSADAQSAVLDLPRVTSQGFDISAARLVGSSNTVEFSGDVTVIQANRQLNAERVITELEAAADTLGSMQRLLLPDGGRWSDTRTQVRAGRIDLNAAAETGLADDVELLLADRGLRGWVQRIQQDDADRAQMQNLVLTRCEPNQLGWSVAINQLRYDEASGTVGLTDFAIRVGDKRVFFWPKFTLNTGTEEQRPAGLISPEIRFSNQDGLDVTVPYGVNLSPHWYATVRPQVITGRGLGLGATLENLGESTQTTLSAQQIFSDDLYNGRYNRDEYKRFGGKAKFGSFQPADRWLGSLQHNGQFAGLTTFVDFSKVSDADFFRDLDPGMPISQPFYVSQKAGFAVRGRHWTARLQTYGFQRLDEFPLAPYRKLPQLTLTYKRPLAGTSAYASSGQVSVDWLLDWTRFTRAPLASNEVYTDPLASLIGERMHLQPELAWRKRWPSGFVSVAGGYRYTQYDLRRVDHPTVTPLANSKPDRGIGFARLEGGLFFDRNVVGSKWQQTVEPRIQYLRSGYARQDHLPLFDVAPRSLGFTELFANNNYFGLDRFSEADKVVVGVTSRLIANSTGNQRLSVSLGKTFHLRTLRYLLSEDLQRFDGELTAAEINLNVSQRWHISANQVWQDDFAQSLETGLALHYRSDNRHIINIAWRDRPVDGISQGELGLYWPVARNYSVVQYLQYDLERNRAVAAIFGIEFDNCCLRARFALRQQENNPSYVGGPEQLAFRGGFDRGVVVEFELKGLARIGRKFESLLLRRMQGYRGATMRIPGKGR